MNKPYHAPIQYKHYGKKRRYGKRKWKINLTLLGIVIFVIACIVGAVLLGNYLRGKVDGGDGSPVFTGDSGDAAPSGPSIGDAAQKHSSMRSGCFSIATGSADALYSAGYDAVTVPLTDKDGALLYNSEAAKALSRQPATTELPSLGEKLGEIKTAAAAHGLEPKISVFYDMTFAESRDPVISEATMLYETAVIAEAYSFGADEALISGIPLTDGGTSALAVIEKLHASVPGMKIRLALPFDVFKDASMSQTLDTLADEAGALAVDTRGLDWSYTATNDSPGTGDGTDGTVDTDGTDGDETSNDAPEYESKIFGELDREAAAIKSSVSLYSLAFVIRGDILFLESEAVDALIKNGVYSYYVVTSPESTAAPPSGGDTDDTDDTDNTDDTGNAGGVPAPGPDTDAPTASDTEPPTEPDTEPDTEPPTEPGTEPDTEPPTEPGTEPDTEPPTEPDTGSDTDPEPDPEPAPDPEPEPEPGSETTAEQYSSGRHQHKRY